MYTSTSSSSMCKSLLLLQVLVSCTYHCLVFSSSLVLPVAAKRDASGNHHRGTKGQQQQLRKVQEETANLEPTNVDSICFPVNNTLTVKVNLFAGELGYYYFEECGGMTSPTIGLEIGKPYTFLQKDPTNYMHPMGFAYSPNGAHFDEPELEPTVTLTPGNSCGDSATCSSPMYFDGDRYLGTYSNLARSDLGITTGQDDFGLDHYEPLFTHPIDTWASQGPFSIKLRFIDDQYDKDIFYFCHIHKFMSGRIKLFKNGTMLNALNDPPLDFEYDEPSSFDENCGTFGLEEFQIPNDSCPRTFVCGADEVADGTPLKTFATCLDAMNCAMLHGMTNTVRGVADVASPVITTTAAESSTSEYSGAASESLLSTAPIALFIDQMISHHENAVNMAKALLKARSSQGEENLCPDLKDAENEENCFVDKLSLSIIAGQNHQIQVMRTVLEQLGYHASSSASDENCQVTFQSSIIQS